MNRMKDKIWITWERQRRNKGICAALGWELNELVYDDSHWMVRYVLSIYLTTKLFVIKKPLYVCAQNPSIILASLVLFLKLFFKYKVIIDSHNSGLFPLEGKSKVLMWLSRLLQKNADLTIVTNQKLKNIVESNSGRAFVLQDKIPDFPTITKSSDHLSGELNIAYICTFSADEPYLNVFKSAQNLPENIHILVTGRYDGKVNPQKLPKNVTLLGFISEEDYWRVLASVDLILDLTTREDCLVCGAYEGIAVNKPLILSDTKAIKSYFNTGCVYVKPGVDSITKGILTAVRMQDKLKTQISELKVSLHEDWNNRMVSLKEKIKSL